MAKKQAGAPRAATARPAPRPAAAPAPAPARAAAPAAAPAKKVRKNIKVRALEMTYYGHILRRPGDVYVLDHEGHLSHAVEEVDPRTPEKVTSHGEALKRHQADVTAATRNEGLNRDDVDDAEVDDNPLGDD